MSTPTSCSSSRVNCSTVGTCRSIVTMTEPRTRTRCGTNEHACETRPRVRADDEAPCISRQMTQSCGASGGAMGIACGARECGGSEMGLGTLDVPPHLAQHFCQPRAGDAIGHRRYL